MTGASGRSLPFRFRDPGECPWSNPCRETRLAFGLNKLTRNGLDLRLIVCRLVGAMRMRTQGALHAWESTSTGTTF